MSNNNVVSWYQNPFMYATLGFGAATATAWELQAGYIALGSLFFAGVTASSFLVGDSGVLV